MEAKRLCFGTVLFTIILFTLGQTGCSGQYIVKPTVIFALNTMETPEPVNTLAPIPTPSLAASLTPHPTIDATQQTWRATAIAIRTADRAASEQSWNEKETQIAQFPAACEDMNFYSSNISPDGKWLAASCSYKSNQIFTVQSKDGKKWVLNFKDFLSPESPEGIPGSLSPKFWSPEGNYLFFTIELGYDGGGNYCFPEYNNGYGLFGLNLSTGSWATVVPSTNSFPGYEIEFSPTGRRYAITIGGVMITDLQTGKVTTLDVNSRIQRLIWSPDGKYLAYSVASCNERSVISSSIYLWDTLKNQSQTLLTKDGTILRPELWSDSATLKISEEKISGPDALVTIYEYSILQDKMVLSGTATPSK